MAVLKNALNGRYCKEQRRMFNDVKELRLYAEELVNQYPVVLSTTFSARTAVPDMVYDYLIMDEASQVSIETGALALTCAKNAVIVGDTLQLPNVVTDEVKLKMDSIFKEYKVMEGTTVLSTAFFSLSVQLCQTSSKSCSESTTAVIQKSSTFAISASMVGIC